MSTTAVTSPILQYVTITLTSLLKFVTGTKARMAISQFTVTIVLAVILIQDYDSFTPHAGPPVHQNRVLHLYLLPHDK